MLQMNIDRVADPTPQEGPRPLAVERPVAEGRASREPSFDLDAEQVDANRLGIALADRWRQVRRLARDIGLDERLRRQLRGDDELALHAGELVPWHAAKIGEIAGFGGAES